MAEAKVVRFLAAGVLAGAVLAAPLLAGSPVPAISATGECLAWIGARDDGQCVGYSNGSPTYIGTPQIGVFGQGNGLGIVTGPLLPGTTITQGLSP